MNNLIVFGHTSSHWHLSILNWFVILFFEDYVLKIYISAIMAWGRSSFNLDILEAVGLMSAWSMLSFEWCINFFRPLGTSWQNFQVSVDCNKFFETIIRNILTIYEMHFYLLNINATTYNCHLVYQNNHPRKMTGTHKIILYRNPPLSALKYSIMRHFPVL